MHNAQIVFDSPDINECASQPCQNRGRCINGDNYFNCECVPGFTGIVCETSKNISFS